MEAAMGAQRLKDLSGFDAERQSAAELLDSLAAR